MALTFGVWYAKEGTLSIHSIFTVRREAFYWLAILFTFALGTASGDLMAEKLGLGYLVTGFIVVGVIAAAGVAWRLGLDAVLAFWIAYILTRLSEHRSAIASLSRRRTADWASVRRSRVRYFSQRFSLLSFFLPSPSEIWSSRCRRKVTPERRGPRVVWQVVAVAILLLGAGGAGYYVRRAQLANHAAASVSLAAPLGDLSHFRQIARDMLKAEGAGNASAAKSRADDLESAWDTAQALMRPMNPQKWTLMDEAIDDVLKKVRAGSGGESASLEGFIHVMDSLADQKSQTPAQAPTPQPSAQGPMSVPRTKPLGDLSGFRTIAEDLLRAERAGDSSHTKARAADLEAAWDQSQARLQPMNPEKWSLMDGAIDKVLTGIRSSQQKPGATTASLAALVAVIDTLDGPK